jgi:PAS domain S-box-containing protein
MFESRPSRVGQQDWATEPGLDGVSPFEAALLETMQQAVIATDMSGTVTFWNRSAEELYGWRAEEALGRNVLDLTPSSQSREQAATIMRRLLAGERWNGEFQVRRRDGSTFSVLVTDAPIRDAEGRLRGIVGFSTNLSDSQSPGEAGRRAHEAVMAALYESRIIGMMVATEDTIVEANDAFLELLGYGREDLEAGAIKWQAMTPPEYAAADQRALAELAERGACTPFEKEYVGKDGRRVPVLLGASVLERAPVRWACFVLDLRERRELERQREELLASISHDIRQPLALIKGRAQLLRRRGGARRRFNPRAFGRRAAGD